MPVIVKQTELGKIEISPTAIAALVSHAASLTYGVAGMAQPNRTSQIAAAFRHDPHRGVEVQVNDEGVLTIDVYILVNFGMNLVSVATSLISTIRYHVENRSTLSVKQVNVHIQGLQMKPKRELV